MLQHKEGLFLQNQASEANNIHTCRAIAISCQRLVSIAISLCQITLKEVKEGQVRRSCTSYTSVLVLERLQRFYSLRRNGRDSKLTTSNFGGLKRRITYFKVKRLIAFLMEVALLEVHQSLVDFKVMGQLAVR